MSSDQLINVRYNIENKIHPEIIKIYQDLTKILSFENDFD